MGLVGQGDRDAFAALYDALVPQVYGVIRRVVRDPAQSEEVAHEVLIEVWRTAARFDCARGGTRTWVMTMAHRRAVDRVRSEQATRDREVRVALEALETPFDPVAAAVDHLFEVDAVRAALRQLTPCQREAIELAYFRGHTYREVAFVLDTPLSTIKTRIRNGLVRLRADLVMTG